MQDSQFLPPAYSSTDIEGRVSWQSPSNIALVKYWGKHGMQLPKNTSLSFTLSKCVTNTSLTFSPKNTKSRFSFELLLDGKPTPNFHPKIESFFSRIEPYCPFVKAFHFKIETSNSFPHSSGIASSASGMSALALCILSVETQLGAHYDEAFFNNKASFLARLGSGSAARSINGPLMLWGTHPEMPESNDLFATAYPFEVHSVFSNFQDVVLLVDEGSKQVSSTVGHNLMHDHPFATSRFAQAQAHISDCKNILSSGDLTAFINLVEREALSLHAMMLSSNPYFVLMQPNTLAILQLIWQFREETKLPVGFTLDAGANVHVLFPKANQKEVLPFIKNQLAKYCVNRKYICDAVGMGAKKM